MARTPEGIVKDKVRKLLATFDVAGKDGYGRLYSHWPVQNGMGNPTLDCIGCYYGVYFAVETKAPGKTPTPRQQLTIKQMLASGAAVFVIDGDEGVEQLRRGLEMIKWAHADSSKQQT